MNQIFYASMIGTGAAFLIIAAVRASLIGPFTASFTFLVGGIDYYACLPYAAALAVALLRPVQRAGLALADACGRHPYAAAGLTAAALAIGTHLLYHAHPLSMDEYAPYFQSTIFAAGEMHGRLPAPLLDWLVPKGFQRMFFTVDRATGAIVSIYYPGMALLLTPFTALGVPWLLNPLLGGATVLVMHRLGRTLLGSERAAGLAALFTIASPAVTLNAVSFYSMPAHLLANALFALLLLRPTPRRAFAAGVTGSIALVLSNPVPHLFFALPWIAWLAADRARRRLLVPLIAGYVPLCGIIGLGWTYYLRGFTTSLAQGAAEPLSLAARMFSGVLQVPTKVVLEARAVALAKLWLWAAPALLVLAGLGAWRLRNDSGPWLALAGSALLTFLGYLFVPYDQGHGWGYRYFHSAWSVLPLLAVAALLPAGGVRPDGVPGDPSSTGPSAAGYAAACALAGLLSVTVLLAVQQEHFIRRHLQQVPQPQPGGQARVLIIDASRPFYRIDLVQNDPFLRNPVLILVSHGRAADEAMMRERFPELSLLSSSERGTVWGIRRR